MPPSATSQLANLDLLRIDDQLTSDERLVRDTVRSYTSDRVMPHIADWFEAGTLPRELVPELGKLGLLGMHLTGYGCAGMGPVAYGVTCREMEAADSGLRSLVSVQGSLSMYPIWRYGSEAQKEEWLPRMAAGEAIGCFGLTEPDHGSDPGGMKTYAKPNEDRKSTRLNSSHDQISYAVFCLKKKKKQDTLRSLHIATNSRQTI